MVLSATKKEKRKKNEQVIQSNKRTRNMNDILLCCVFVLLYVDNRGIVLDIYEHNISKSDLF